MVGDMVKLLNSLSMDPLLYFFCYKVSSLLINNAVWSTIMVDKAFCKLMDGSFGWSIVFREDESVSRVSIYSNKNKTLLFPWGKWSNVISLPPGSWPIIPGNGAILGSQGWFLFLADWALSNDCSQIILGVWESMSLRQCRTSIIATLFMSPLVKTGVTEERHWLLSIEPIILSTW